MNIMDSFVDQLNKCYKITKGVPISESAIDEIKQRYDKAIELGLVRKDYLHKEKLNILHYGITRGHLEVVLYIQKHFGITVEDIHSKGDLVLLNAIYSSNTKLLDYLIDEVGITRRDFTTENYVILRMLIHKGRERVDIIKYLVERLGITLDDVYSSVNHIFYYKDKDVIQYFKERFSLDNNAVSYISSNNYYSYIKRCFYSMLP